MHEGAQISRADRDKLDIDEFPMFLCKNIGCDPILELSCQDVMTPHLTYV